MKIKCSNLLFVLISLCVIILFSSCAEIHNFTSKNNKDDETNKKYNLIFGGSFSSSIVGWPHSICITSDGKYLYAATVYSNSIIWFEKTSSGALLFKGQFFDDDPNSPTYMGSPRSVIVSKDGNFLYSGNYESDTIMWFKRNKDNGSIEYAGKYTSSSNIRLPWCLSISPENEYIYVGAATAIAWFKMDKDTGAIDYKGKYEDSFNVNWPKSISFTSDGAYAYVGVNSNYSHNGIISLTRNTSNGALSFKEGYKISDEQVGGMSVAVSYDDKNVYVAVPYENKIGWFTRSSTGALTNFKYISNDNIKNAWAITMSSNSNYLYVTANSDAVSWFERDNTNGDLKYVNSYYNPNLIDWACSMCISPDDQNIYVGSAHAGSITWFTRGIK